MPESEVMSEWKFSCGRGQISDEPPGGSFMRIESIDNN